MPRVAHLNQAQAGDELSAGSADLSRVSEFVGRDAERAALDAAWARARSGESAVVSVHGAAGYGKTTLVTDFLSRARPGMLLHATGDPDETTLPFGVLGQLFRPGAAPLGSLPAPLKAALAGEPADPLAVGSAVLEALGRLSGGDDSGAAYDGAPGDAHDGDHDDVLSSSRDGDHDDVLGRARGSARDYVRKGVPGDNRNGLSHDGVSGVDRDGVLRVNRNGLSHDGVSGGTRPAPGTEPRHIRPAEPGKDRRHRPADPRDAPAGLVIVVDDVQWADTPSIRALVFALRRLRAERVLAVLIRRDDSLGDLPFGLQRLLQDAAIDVAVGEFGPSEMAGLARERGIRELSRRALTRLVESSAGSPLHAAALLDELTPDQLEDDPDAPLPAPRTFAGLILARLRSCDDAARALVQGAAVMGDGESLRRIAQVAGVDDPFQVFDRAAVGGLLDPLLAGGAVRLAHPLTRSAVYHAIPAAERAGLHRRAAALLAQTNEMASLRHRVAASSGTDAGLADAVAARASADVARGAWLAAAEGFRVAAELCGPHHPAVSEYTLRMVECLALGGDVAAVRVAAAAIERRERGALRDYALGRMHALTGDLPAAAELMASAWEQQEQRQAADPTLAARIAGESARLAVMTGRGLDAIDWAQRALGLASPEDAARGDAMTVMLLAFGILGRSRDGLALVADLPEEVHEPTPAQLDGIVGRGLMSLWNDDLERARADLGLAVKVTRRTGPVHLNLWVAAYSADTAYRLGDWDLAIAEAETGAALARDLDNAWTLPMLHALAALPHAARGDFDVARAHVDAALAAADAAGDVPNRLWAVIARARLARARWDAAGVVEALESLDAIKHLDGVREPGVQAWQSLYAGGLVATGRFDDAEAVLDEAAGFALSRGHRVEELAVERIRARLAAARGDLPGAFAVIERASELRDSIDGRPFETAQFDLARGALLRRAGKRSAAAGLLRQALAVFEELGAEPWAEQTRQELRRSGASQRAARSTELTPHEEMVAGLVAQGLSNRRIADQLGVTPKAVEYHLSNVYAKLGVHSRVQLATLHSALEAGPDRA